MSDTAAEGDSVAPSIEDKGMQIKRIFLKDMSFENPNLPLLLSQTDEAPSIMLAISSAGKVVSGDLHEVVLNVVVKAVLNEKIAYMAEVQQAGIFEIRGFTDEELRRIKGVYCAEILFPYARAVISDLVARGSLPQLIVMPVNFSQVYQEMENSAEDLVDTRLPKQYEIYLRATR